MDLRSTDQRQSLHSCVNPGQQVPHFLHLALQLELAVVEEGHRLHELAHVPGHPVDDHGDGVGHIPEDLRHGVLVGGLGQIVRGRHTLPRILRRRLLFTPASQHHHSVLSLPVHPLRNGRKLGQGLQEVSLLEDQTLHLLRQGLGRVVPGDSQLHLDVPERLTLVHLDGWVPSPILGEHAAHRAGHNEVELIGVIMPHVDQLIFFELIRNQARSDESEEVDVVEAHKKIQLQMLPLMHPAEQQLPQRGRELPSERSQLLAADVLHRQGPVRVLQFNVLPQLLVVPELHGSRRREVHQGRELGLHRQVRPSLVHHRGAHRSHTNGIPRHPKEHASHGEQALPDGGGRDGNFAVPHRGDGR
mmetsp:Transcript_84445/g.225643  ORF Transcript_84445/g.225643 Transcript_84445/m.225643 type:complete len:359 (-) Transcript_84445:1687-2763(-)